MVLFGLKDSSRSTTVRECTALLLLLVNSSTHLFMVLHLRLEVGAAPFNVNM